MQTALCRPNEKQETEYIYIYIPYKYIYPQLVIKIVCLEKEKSVPRIEGERWRVHVMQNILRVGCISLIYTMRA